MKNVITITKTSGISKTKSTNLAFALSRFCAIKVVGKAISSSSKICSDDKLLLKNSFLVT